MRLYWIKVGPNPMTGVYKMRAREICAQRHGNTQRGEGHMETDAERDNAATALNRRVASSCEKLGEGRRALPWSRACRGTALLQRRHADSACRLLASRNLREYVSIVLSHPLVFICFDTPRKSI